MALSCNEIRRSEKLNRPFIPHNDDVEEEKKNQLKPIFKITKSFQSLIHLFINLSTNPHSNQFEEFSFSPHLSECSPFQSSSSGRLIPKFNECYRHRASDCFCLHLWFVQSVWHTSYVIYGQWCQWQRLFIDR